MDTEPIIPEGQDLDDDDQAPAKPRHRRRARGSGGSKPKELLEPPVQVHRQWATSDYRWQETLDTIPTRREVYDRFGAGKYRLDCQGGGRVYWKLQRRPGVNSRSSEAHIMDDPSPADELRASQARIAELEAKLDALAAATPRPPPPGNPWGPPTPQAPAWQPQAPAWQPPPQAAQAWPQPQAPGPPPGYVWHPQQGWIQMAPPAQQFAPGPFHPTTNDPLAQLRQFRDYKVLIDELWPDGAAPDEWEDDEDDEPADVQTMITNGIRDAIASRFGGARPPSSTPPTAPAPPIAAVPSPTPATGALPGETAEHAAELVALATELGQDPGAVRELAHQRGYTAEQAVKIGRQLVTQARQAS